MANHAITEAPVVHIGENSPERIAYVLTRDVLFNIEKREWSTLSRQDYLNAYVDCILAVRGHRPESDKPPGR